ncbi:MAG: nuclear transport factor 2 family protein, partial [Alcaligenaceae bacterium]
MTLINDVATRRAASQRALAEHLRLTALGRV